MKFNNFPPTKYRDAEFTEVERMVLVGANARVRPTQIASYALVAASTIAELTKDIPEVEMTDIFEIGVGLQESLRLRGAESNAFATNFRFAATAASIGAIVEANEGVRA